MIIYRQRNYSEIYKPSDGISKFPINTLKNILKDWKNTIVDNIWKLDKELFSDELKNGEITKTDFEDINISTILFELINNEIELTVEPNKNSKLSKKYDWYWTLIFSSKTGKFLGWGD